jgi:thymidylate kinase
MGEVICIGGLISVGKSTLIKRMVSHCGDHALSLHVMPELLCPTLCSKLPIDPVLFDTFMIGHRLQMSMDARHIAKSFDIVAMERCHLDHLAFLDAILAVGWASRDYAEWIRGVVHELRAPPPDRFIFLDVEPEVAFTRMKARAEVRDAAFTLEFFQVLRASYLKVLEECPKVLMLDWSNFGAGSLAFL